MNAKKHPRPPTQQCIECALLSGKDARKKRKLYGPKALDERFEFCWDQSVCPRRRNYYQNAESENSRRRAERIAEKAQADASNVATISVPDPPLKTPYVAYLYLYRTVPKNARTHAIAGTVYKDGKLEAEIEAFHCAGHDPEWIERKVGMILFKLRAEYGIQKFESFQRFDPIKCPIRPCPLHLSEGESDD
jgi:hypothetical protein